MLYVHIMLLQTPGGAISRTTYLMSTQCYRRLSGAVFQNYKFMSIQCRCTRPAEQFSGNTRVMSMQCCCTRPAEQFSRTIRVMFMQCCCTRPAAQIFQNHKFMSMQCCCTRLAEQCSRTTRVMSIQCCCTRPAEQFSRTTRVMSMQCCCTRPAEQFSRTKGMLLYTTGRAIFQNHKFMSTQCCCSRLAEQSSRITRYMSTQCCCRRLAEQLFPEPCALCPQYTSTDGLMEKLPRTTQVYHVHKTVLQVVSRGSCFQNHTAVQSQNAPAGAVKSNCFHNHIPQVHMMLWQNLTIKHNLCLRNVGQYSNGVINLGVAFTRGCQFP